MISRTRKTPLRTTLLTGMVLLLPVSQAAAYSVKYAPGYSSKRSSDVEFIYPKGNVQTVAGAEDVADDRPADIIEYHVTNNRHVHITVRHVRPHYRPYIRVHRAATFYPSRIRVHRAGQFRY